MIGLRCHNYDKNWERFAVISKQCEFLVNCFQCTPECCTHKLIGKFCVFRTGSLYDDFKIVLIEKNYFTIPLYWGLLARFTIYRKS